MRKNISKKVGKKNNLIVESNKSQSDEKSLKFQEKILEIGDSELEALFESGKITQYEYEYILNFRKKQKERKKSQKEKFEERIRCNNEIITKIINLGRKFRVENLLSKGKFEEARKADISHDILEIEENQEYQIDSRTRDKQKEERLKQKYMDRNFRGRGRERDSR